MEYEVYRDDDGEAHTDALGSFTLCTVSLNTQADHLKKPIAMSYNKPLMFSFQEYKQIPTHNKNTVAANLEKDTFPYIPPKHSGLVTRRTLRSPIMVGQS